MKFLKILDIIGFEPKFNVDLRNKIKLEFGGALTLFYIIMYIYLFQFFGQDCFQKKNPKGFSQIKKNEEQQFSMKIKDNHFFVGIKISDGFNPDKDYFKEYMYLTFEYLNVEIGTKTTWETIPLDAIPCDQVNFDKNKTEVGSFNLTDFYCPNTTKISDREIKGNWLTGNRSNIIAKVSFCDKGDMKKCKDPKKVKEYFANRRIILNLLYPEVDYNIDDPEKPFSNYLNLHYNYISPNKYTFEEIYSSRSELKEDVGVFFSDYNTKEAFGISKELYYSDSKGAQETYYNTEATPDNSVIYELMFYFNTNKNFYHRSYLKIPDILAKSASIIQILMTLFGIIYEIYARKKFESLLCNRLIFIEDDDGLISFSKKISLDLDKKTIRDFFKEKENLDNLKNNKKPTGNLDVIKEGVKNIIAPRVQNLSKNPEVVQRFKKGNDRSKSKNEGTNFLKNLIVGKIPNANIPIDDSNRNMVELDFTDNHKKVKSYLENVFKKFREEKNKMNTNLTLSFKSAICPKKVILKKQNDFFNYFRKKFMEKLDIFYYMRQDKINKIIENLTLNKDQNKLKEVISRKSFTVNFTTVELDNKNPNIEDDNLILEYLLKNGETSDSVFIDQILA